MDETYQKLAQSILFELVPGSETTFRNGEYRSVITILQGHDKRISQIF